MGLSGSLADLSGDTTITSYRYPRGVHPATESPSAQNIVVLCGTDGSANKHYFQRPFWHKNSATIDSTNWLKWGESLTTTLNGAQSSNLIVLTAGESTDDYYNGWLVHNTTQNEFAFVRDYTGSNLNVTLYASQGDWASGNTVILYRHFHDNPTFSPSWTDPIALKVGNNIVASGGQGSTVGYKALWSGYLNKSFFLGHGDSEVLVVNQTYVTEAEIKSTAGYTIGAAAGYTATSPLDTTAASRWFTGFVFETDDGQRSNLITNASNYVDVTAVQGVRTNVIIHPARLNKRFRYLDVFMGTDSTATRTSLEWEEYFYVRRYDLTSDTGTDWTAGTGGTSGQFNRDLDFDEADWNSRGESLDTYLGHTEPARSTVSFSYGEVAGGRLIVAKYYDYVAALSYSDQINFSPFASNGVAQYNKLCDIDDLVQTTIEAGDPSSIQGLAQIDGKLFIPKNRGIYSIDVTYDPSQWILNTITREIGCDAPDSIVETPNGIIWAKYQDGIYLWRGGDPIELTRNWRDTFRALTVTSDDTTIIDDWWAWYDPYYRSYRIMYTSNGTTKTTVYEAFLDVQDPALGNLPIWTKHIMGHNVGQVTVRSDGAVFFSTGADKTYQFASSDSDDEGTAITPYFKLGTRVIDEGKLLVLQGFELTASKNGNTANTLDFSVYVDGNVLGTFTTLTNANAASLTNVRWASELPDIDSDGHTRVGSNFDFAFNSNATRGSLGTSFTVFELAFRYYLMERGGDVSQSL